MGDRGLAERALAARIIRIEEQAADMLSHTEHLCEQKYTRISRDAAESSRVQEDGRQKQQDRLVHEVEDLRRRLHAERRSREQADDDIVAALNHYTQALQGAVCTVSQGALR